MKTQNIFKDWVPTWLAVLVSIFCMMHCMILLGVYTSNATYAASFLDIEPEDLQYAMSITYGTFLCTIMIEGRLFKYFPTKKYLVAIYFISAICITISAFVKNYHLFMCLRIIEGVLMALPWLPLRHMIISKLRSKNAVIIGFSFNYGALLMATPFIMSLTVWILDNYNWKYMTFISASFQVFCAVLVILTFNNNRFYKKLPLYQIDWTSYFLTLVAILTGSFVLIYGEKLYWFQSPKIILYTSLSLITGGMFLYRQNFLKRPALDLNIFRYRNLLLGVSLFIFFYIARATLNICHATMLTVWYWEPIRVANVQYINLAGNILGMICAAYLLAKSFDVLKIFAIGFFFLAIYHFAFTFLFVPDVRISDIAIPYAMQGFAVGILFVPLVLFTVSAVPPKYASFSGLMGVFGRFSGSTIGFCIMQNANVFFINKHYDKLSQFTLAESPEMQNRIDIETSNFIAKGFSTNEAANLALKNMVSQVKEQASLLSQMEIYTYVGYTMLLICLLLLCTQPLFKTYKLFRNKLWSS